MGDTSLPDMRIAERKIIARLRRIGKRGTIQFMSELIEEQSVDRNAFEVIPLSEEGDDRAYWQSKTPAERLLALEIMRQIVYGYDPSTTRLQRVLEIARRE